MRLVPRDMPAIRGKVIGVDAELDIVLVSVGSEDGVEVGYTMTVYDAGDYVGKFLVEKVGPDWAAGHMDEALEKRFPVKGNLTATDL